MEVLKQVSSTGGASGCSRLSGTTSGLANSRVREAGSGHRGKSNKHPKFRVATLNVGTLRRRGPEVVETLTRRRVDLCAIQEHRWRGASARLIKGKDSVYKFFWSGNPEGQGGVGILLAERWIKNVFEVQRINDRIILLRLIIGKKVYTFFSVYAPQVGLSEGKKEQFYDSLQFHMSSIPASEVVVPLGDWNGHVGASCDEFADVHGGHGYGTRNDAGERLLEFARANDLVIGNTRFIKRRSHLITYCSGTCKTQIDYILYRKSFCRAVCDVKVIPYEECALQHHLVVCDFTVHLPANKRRKFTPRIRTWKLKDPEVSRRFREVFLAKASASSSTRFNCPIEDAWSKLKGPLLDTAGEVCGLSSNHQWRPETWWWNDRVDDAIAEKRARYKALKALGQSDRPDKSMVAKAKTDYSIAKRDAKRAVWLAKSDADKAEFAKVSPNDSSIFKLAKQMDRSNQDVVGEICIRDDHGKLALSDDEKMEAWVEHYARLLNVEFDWPSDLLPEVPPVEGPPPPVTTKMVSDAIEKMKSGKAAGPSGIVAEMVKATGDLGVEQIRVLTEAVVCNGAIPKDWEESHILNLYKGKGVALDRGNYRGLKLTDQVLKLQERMMVTLIRQMVDIDAMQFSFTPGKGTTDALFIVRQLQEKHLAANKRLYLAFVDLEKAFDRVPRNVLWWAMRSLGVEEWAVRVVQGMYSNARSRVRVNGQYSKEFDVGVGVHQGSVLSPLLFIMVLEALSREFRTGTPWELLYADDLVIIADSLEECVAKLKVWKRGMESKGLRVNMAKTKFMVSGLGLDVLTESGEHPCAVCLKGVRQNSIFCSSCQKWVHGRTCSGIVGRLTPIPNYVCPRCKGKSRDIDGRPLTKVTVDDVDLDVVPSFCYLGDMLSAGGGCDLAIKARCRSAWAKFKSLLPVLTSKHLALKTRGHLFSTCVRPVMLYGSETWAPTSSDLQRLRRNDRSMIRWICGVRPSDDVSPTTLHKRLGIREVSEVLSTGRLRWYGHVKRASSCINSVTNLEVPGSRGRGRPRKAWSDCVKDDLKVRNMVGVDPSVREDWRACLRSQTAAQPEAVLCAARSGGPMTRSQSRRSRQQDNINSI